MLHDNFPTNIFSISELSTFGYTRYSHTCSTRQFARQLNADSWSRSVSRSRPTSALNSTPSQPNNSNNNNQPLHHHTHDGHPIHASAAGSAGQGGGGGEAIHSLQEYDPLLAAYISLLTARVPCHWRYSDKLRENGNGSNSRDRSNVVERELWVFWLNDQSLLQNHGLEKLKECQSGIMTWDAILQYNTPGFVNTPQTPRSATHPSMFAADHHVPNSNQEYEMFMCGLRNVLDRGLVVKAGYRLGESYVFPASIQPKLDDSILPSYPKLPSLTMMSCTVTMYLSSSNLVVQPTFQYHRLRTLDVEDIDSRQSSEKELSVLLSPHGTTAVLKLNAMSEFTEEQTQKCLDAWEQLFGTNQEHASNLARSLPRLVSVSIKAGNSEVLLQYPTERVFVPVSCKDSPSDVGQLDGMGSRNAGFIEDLGAKFALWSWQEMTKNAIESPAVPKLVQSLADHAPVLAEPKNRIKTGSFAWNQQNQQQIQQQQQQHQQQQQQQRQQASFLQQQQDALAKRDSSDTNKIDYWFYTDPHSYLTSIVLNSCANAEPKTADSPSAADTQLNVVAPSTPAKSSSSKPKVKAKTNGTTESDGWIRRKPKRNAVTSSSFIHTGAAEAPSSSTSAWNGDPDSSAAPASYPDTTEQFNGNNSNNDSKGDTAQTDTQNAPAAASNTSSYPLELQSDASYMMPGLMGSNSMMGLYGGSTDDFDFDEVNDDDFSYFEQPQNTLPTPSLPAAPSTAFDTPSIQSSIPTASTAPLAGSTPIPSTSSLMGAFTDSSLNDDSLFADMELDLTSFAQPTPPASTILSLGTSDKLATTPSATLVASPSVDQLLLNQLPHELGMLTPTPLASVPEKDPNHQLHISAHLPLVTAAQSIGRRSSSILVEHLRSPTQSYIPSSFAPLKIVGDYFVDDTKYQAGGRFVYKKLYKRRRSSIPTTYSPYRRESRLLPFYQPGKGQEWIVPTRKVRQVKQKPRTFSLGANWKSFRKEDASTSKREEHQVKDHPAIKDPAVSTTAWGISTLSLQQFNQIKEEEESTSGSDSDSSSTSTGDSDDEGATPPLHPRFGKLIKRPSTGSTHADDESSRLWCVRGVNSAMFVDAAMGQSTDHSIGGVIMGLNSFATSPHGRPITKSRSSEFASRREGAKLWQCTEDYYSQVEFDTPFTPAILSAAPPALVPEPMTVQESLAAEYFLESVKTLCEQAVMGGYPFAGSNEVTGTSGEITEGESFHAMIARRKAMTGILHEGVATIPALGDESFRNMMEMKTIVFDLFDRLRGNQSDHVAALPVPSDASQDITMNMTTIHGHRHHSSQSNITSPVVMKGPLTLYQYFTLAEVQQMPSKYGKYAVKKKKPAEPALAQLPPPDIVVGHNEEWLEAAPTILRFWEKLSLEPYAGKKHISYFVVYPDGPDMENSVCKFWRELSIVFETSLLGKHQPGSIQEYKTGLVPIPLLAPLPGETMEGRQVRSYLDGCQQLGSILGGMSTLRDTHTVIYMVNPFSHGAGYFDLCRCFSIMKTQFRTAALGSLLTPLEQQRERLILQVVPIQHVIYPSTFGGYLRFGLKDIAFTVYSKCKLFLERPVYSQGMMAQFNSYAPSFALAKSQATTIYYDVGQKPNTVPKPQATLHVGYGFSLDKRWLICVWTDHRGEMLEHMTLDMMDRSNSIQGTTLSKNNSNGNGTRPLEECLQEISAAVPTQPRHRALVLWNDTKCKRYQHPCWIRIECHDSRHIHDTNNIPGGGRIAWL